MLRARLLAVLTIAALFACVERHDAVELPAVLELDGDTVQLAPGARIVDIAVGGAEDGDEFEPVLVEAQPGDVVRFRARDAGPHALVFDASTSDSAAVAFLNATDQLRALPFLQVGAEWVVTLESAVPGRYVTRCLTHGETVTIRVVANRTGRDG